MGVGVGGAPWRAARLGPGAVCRGPRGLVRGCMPPHASGWARPGRNSASGARGREWGGRAGAGRAAWSWAGGGCVGPGLVPWGPLGMQGAPSEKGIVPGWPSSF